MSAALHIETLEIDRFVGISTYGEFCSVLDFNGESLIDHSGQILKNKIYAAISKQLKEKAQKALAEALAEHLGITASQPEE